MRSNAVQNSESDVSVHEQMIRTLLKTPHRNYDETLDIHRKQFQVDPNFYAKLAFWSVGLGNNSVRDVNEIFIAILFNSSFDEHKELAYVLLQNLPPYQVERVGNLFTGHDEIVKHRSYEPPIDTRFGVKSIPAKYGKSHHDVNLREKQIPAKTVKVCKKLRELLEKQGIKFSGNEFTVSSLRVSHPYLNNRHFKGMFRRAINSYLQLRENNPSMMEGALIRSKKSIKKLYAKSNRLPLNDENSWINKFLFKNEAPVGTRLFALKKLAASKDPTEQSAIIIDNKIPYPVAASVISNMTPSVMVSLIEVMSSSELLSNLSSLQKRGAMDNADIKKLIENKLTKAKKEKGRLDAMKGAMAVNSVKNLDDSIKEAAIAVTDSQMKRHGKIRARTAIAIDKSGSMTNAIELGKMVAAAIAQSCTENNTPIVYLFDSQPVLISWKSSDGDITNKSSWDKKLKMFSASGGTVPGSVVKSLISQKTQVDQILLITDEEENFGAVPFSSSMKDYEKTFGYMPSVVIVRLGKSLNVIEKSCKTAGVQVDVLPVTNIDSFSIPNLVQLLSRKTMFDLVQEILNLDLPTKEEFDKKNGLLSIND